MKNNYEPNEQFFEMLRKLKVEAESNPDYIKGQFTAIFGSLARGNKT